MPLRDPVAFVGLGNMGAPMAARLLEAGHTVRAFDPVESALNRLVRAGALRSASAADAARGARHVLLMLPDSATVSAVVRDPAFLDGLEPGSLVVDMSSSDPHVNRELATFLTGHGVRMIDAPVSGGVGGAEAGTLTIMAGGEATEVEDARVVLDVLGRVVHAGSVGAGDAVKALNNLLSATHLWATGEVMAAGERFGLDPEVMLSIFDGSSGRSGSTEAKWPRFVLPGTYDSGFGLRLMLKDMRIAIGLCEQAGLPARLGERLVEMWSGAADDLHAAADHTEVARWLQAPGHAGRAGAEGASASDSEIAS